MIPKAKNSLRQYAHALRKEIFSNNTLYNKACSESQLAVIQSEFFKNATIILAYASIKEEAKTTDIIEKAWSMNKQVFFPKCRKNEDGIMDFALCKNFSDLEEGQFKIQEPKSHCPIVDNRIFNHGQCLILVPALAFDETGHRLGYGKGFYDRFLTKIPLAIRIGITFDTLIFPSVPTNSWDIAVNYLASQKGLCKVIII